MAISTSSVWEVRPSAGNANNGGFFKTGASGTDYSQQNAAQYALSGLTSAGAGNTVLSAAAAADMVGNGAQVISGTNFNTGFFEVVSVSVGVSITFSTNAAGQSILTGIGASGVINIGGAIVSPKVANDAGSANNIVWCKATGSFTDTSATTVTLDSSAAPGNPLTFIGYTSSRGDNGQFTWTTATNSISLVEFTQARNVLFQNIIFSTTAGTPGKGINAKNTGNSFQIMLKNCKLSGFSQGVVGDFNVDWAICGLSIIKCRITGCTSHGLANSGGTYILGSTFDNNGGDGAKWTTGSPWVNAAWSVQNSIFYQNAANGLEVAGTNSAGTTMPQITISFCDFSKNTLAGILMGDVNNPLSQISNSIFDVNSTYGISTGSASTTVQALMLNNAFFNNTTAATLGVNTGEGTVTLSADPYTSIGTDFSLNSTAGGGAACKGAAFPGVLQFGGTGHADIGALQSSGSGGGGGLAIFSGMQGGMNG